MSSIVGGDIQAICDLSRSSRLFSYINRSTLHRLISLHLNNRITSSRFMYVAANVVTQLINDLIHQESIQMNNYFAPELRAGLAEPANAVCIGPLPNLRVPAEYNLD
uniref:Uncharacterized protein n=1 Tax=Bracon brevicornis TaxID=1563983 RepID=A0A6V7L7E8_9HYME